MGFRLSLRDAKDVLENFYIYGDKNNQILSTTALFDEDNTHDLDCNCLFCLAMDLFCSSYDKD